MHSAEKMERIDGKSKLKFLSEEAIKERSKESEFLNDSRSAMSKRSGRLKTDESIFVELEAIDMTILLHLH